MIIDAHAHVFERISGMSNGQPISSAEYGTVKTGNTISQFLPASFKNTSSTVEMLLAHMKWGNVEKALLLPNVLYGYHNEYNLKAVNSYPDNFKAMALVDIIKGRKAAEELNKLIVNHGFCGLKIEVASAFQCVPAMSMDSEAIEPVWSCCEDLKLAVAVHPARKDDIRALKAIIDKYRNIKYIICHFGAEAIFLSGHTKGGECLVELLDIFANKDNVWMDTSSVPYFFGVEDYPFTRTYMMIKNAYEYLGPERILWGTDYPGMLMMATYTQLVDFIMKGMGKISDRHLEMIMGGNAFNLFWS
ncbi:MAG: amidohydrolase family protein [Clostridiales bacterium]|nr:amidohydrolase family protein [Clostridiales bacterium]